MYQDSLPDGAPRPADDNLLAVYRMMPTSDIERLLEHIDWLEKELEHERNMVRTTEQKLLHLTRMIGRHTRDVRAELREFGG